MIGLVGLKAPSLSLRLGRLNTSLCCPFAPQRIMHLYHAAAVVSIGNSFLWWQVDYDTP